LKRKHILRVMSLSPGEQKILLELVEVASQQLSNNGCNDFDLSEHLSEAEVDKLAQEYHAYNGDPGEFRPDEDNSLAVPDFALISYLTKKALGLTTNDR
jgi:hypothetical protein